MGSRCSLPPIPTQDVLLQSGDTPGAICSAKPFFFLSAIYMDGDCRSELAPTYKLHVKENKRLPSAQPVPPAFGEVNSRGRRNAPHPPSAPPGMSAGDKQAAQHPVSATEWELE